jgi:dGTPase
VRPTQLVRQVIQRHSTAHRAWRVNLGRTGALGLRPAPLARAAHRRGASPPRNEHQRDRDRIVHSTAFRRLVYKTQVFINHEGDLFRTRLTHSLEVAQLARSAARALRLNEDLVEAIALAHDLGHTPFGHAGQDALHECMREHGGFEHNLQSLRVVDRWKRATRPSTA